LHNYCDCGKTYYYITYSECVVLALVIRHANASAIYWHVWHLSLCQILSHKGHDFRKNFTDIKCVFRSYLQMLSETFLILRSIKLDTVINIHRYSLYSCEVLMKPGFSGQIIEKSLNIKFHAYPSSGSRVDLCGRTYGWTDIQTRRS
jgi:hypothetical protein